MKAAKTVLDTKPSIKQYFISATQKKNIASHYLWYI